MYMSVVCRGVTKMYCVSTTKKVSRAQTADMLFKKSLWADVEHSIAHTVKNKCDLQSQLFGLEYQIVHAECVDEFVFQNTRRLRWCALVTFARNDRSSLVLFPTDFHDDQTLNREQEPILFHLKNISV